ncbi:MAG: molybdopterin cofactor-binding domain-containing protein, partial [bacterium]
GLTGAKRGCGKGQCGTCTVLLNGRAVKSCVIKLKSTRLKDARIETIESLAAPSGDLHPIQEAFVRSGALQCGFCTPGMIMSVKGLLLENPTPDRDAIRHYLKSRNLCRCTGYQKIFTAVDQAAKVMHGAQTGSAELPNDTPLRAQEAVRKVTGSLKYADDITWDNMLVGKILFAEQAPSVLTEIDCSAATGLPGIAGVITAEDIRGSRRTGLVDRDQPALIAAGDTIRTIADPLGAVFAQTPEQAEAALSAIKVTCRKLPGVYTIDAAEQPGAPLVWEDKPGNLFYRGRIERGDMAESLQQADLVVSGNFSTSRIAHGFLEPESGLARPDGSGGVEIHYPSQTVFDDQIQVADVLGIPRQQVRVVQLPTGGAFGGKEDLVFQHILALAALKFQRPVKITLTRDESLRVSQKKHPMNFQARLAINREGLFQGLDVEVAADKGAYASLGFDIIENAMAFVGGPYFIPSVRINGRSVYTHNVMSGAMRGFGANQGNFVIESLVDMAACELGMDPFEIRFINALRPGLPTVTDHLLEPGIAGIEETLLAARETWQRETPPAPSPGKRLGMGIACGVKNVGFGHGLPESAGARVELKDDGSCHLFVTHHEYGQGAVIGQARIASEILGIPIEKITVSSPDTSLTPYTGASTASRQTFLSGNATLGACRQLKSELFEQAAARLSVLDPASLKLEGDHIVTMDGRHRLPLADLGSAFTAEFRAFPPETEGL